MAAILQFQKKQSSEQQHFASGHSATILLYTGVRFERIDFEALRDAHANNEETRILSPTRLAN